MAIGDDFYTQLEGDVEFGGMGDVFVGSFFGSLWKGLKKVIKPIFKGLASSKLVQDKLNEHYPGAGDALIPGLQLIEAGLSSDPVVAKPAVVQIKAITDAAKAGDVAKQGAHDMLKAIKESRNEAKAEARPAVVVGKYQVKFPDGSKKSFKNKKAAQAWLQTAPGKAYAQQHGGSSKSARGRAPGQPAQRAPGQPATQANVAQAMRRLPAARRPQLAASLQQAQLQGLYPVQPIGQPAYGTAAWYAQQQQAQGYPYGMAASQPYGYGVPAPMTMPYGGAYADEGIYEQSSYYYGDDAELAAAFAQDEQFPDEGLVQE